MKSIVTRLTLGIILVLVLMFDSPGYAQIDPETIVGIWLLDEGTGKSTKDSSGNGYHGELMKEAKWVSGQFGEALEFDGVDDRVDCGDVDALDFGRGDFTLCVWVNAAASGAGEAGNGWSRILDKHYTTGFSLMRSGGGAKVQFEVGGNAQTTITTKDVFDDNWHHIAAIRYDDTKSKIYIDGELDIEGNLVGGEMQNDLHFCMAYDNLGLGGNMKCRLDDVAIFNIALSDDEVKTIMTEGLATMLAVAPQEKLATTWSSIKVH
jgi:hypothetical protein